MHSQLRIITALLNYWPSINKSTIEMCLMTDTSWQSGRRGRMGTYNARTHLVNSRACANQEGYIVNRKCYISTAPSQTTPSRIKPSLPPPDSNMPALDQWLRSFFYIFVDSPILCGPEDVKESLAVMQSLIESLWFEDLAWHWDRGNSL